MTVFLMLADPDNYHYVVPENSDDWDKIEDLFDGTSLQHVWQPMRVKLIREDGKDGDFPSLVPYVPVFSARAKGALANIIASYGEFLPLTCVDSDLFAFNVTKILDALDEDASDVQRFSSSGRIMSIDRYEFRAEKLKQSVLFKIPQFRRSYVFVTDQFVERVQSSRLMGFTFQPVWSG